MSSTLRKHLCFLQEDEDRNGKETSFFSQHRGAKIGTFYALNFCLLCTFNNEIPLQTEYQAHTRRHLGALPFPTRSPKRSKIDSKRNRCCKSLYFILVLILWCLQMRGKTTVCKLVIKF